MYTGGVYIGEGLSLTDLHYAERFCFSKTAFTVFFTVSKAAEPTGIFFLVIRFFHKEKN